VVVVTHLLDSDHLSILQHPSSAEYPAVVGHITSLPAGSVVASVVSVHEQILGAVTIISQAKKAAQVVRGYEFISQTLAAITPFIILPFDDPAATAFDQLKAQKVRVGTMDLRIAAIALARNLVLVTRNARDFGRVPGLQIEDWTK
jgi:tRNA(fMet)-specific endonuclease VapC